MSAKMAANGIRNHARPISFYGDFYPSLKSCLLDCLEWIPNWGACIDAWLFGDVTRSFRLTT